MSRTRHARPAQTGDDLSRVTQAAISLADDATRLNRSHERMLRAIDAARAAGHEDRTIEFAVSMAGRGRPDRRESLRTVVRALGGEG